MNHTFKNIETSYGILTVEANFIPPEGDGWYTPLEPSYWEIETVTGIRETYDEEDNVTKTVISRYSDLTTQEMLELNELIVQEGEEVMKYYAEEAAEAKLDRYERGCV